MEGVQQQYTFDRRRELAEFLRSRRERLSPEQAGLPQGSRRRTPGLRRTEVALLAGVSVEWYTWLEQGRDIQVSVQLLESLSRALQLNMDERRHLFMLAHRQPPPEDGVVQTKISPTLQRVLDALSPTPGCVLDARLNVASWNEAFCAVYGAYDGMTERERNLVWCTFASPYFRQLKGAEWEDHALRALAQFRAGYGRFAGEDPWWAEFIQDLSHISPEFNELWERHEVIHAPAGVKLIQHPVAGLLSFEHTTLYVPESPDLQILINLPLPSTDTADKLQQLIHLHRAGTP